MKGPFKQYGTFIHDDERYILELLDGTKSDPRPLELGSPNWQTMMEYAAFIVRCCNAHTDLIYCLKSIINDLPSNRDWLNPDIERMARGLIKEHTND